MTAITREQAQSYQDQVWMQQETQGGCIDGSLCGGMGSVTLDLHYTHPAFGRSFTCICQRQQVQLKRWGATHIPARYQNCSLEWFDAQSLAQRQGKIDGRAWAQRMVNGEMGDKQGLALVGTFGAGKSGLMACIALAWMQRGVQVLWTDANEMIDAILRVYEMDRHPELFKDLPQGERFTVSQIVESAQRAELLCLDDLGDVNATKDVTDHTRSKIYDVIRYRHANMLPTVITSNAANYNGLEQMWGGRIAEKISESCEVVVMGGISFRTGMKR